VRFLLGWLILMPFAGAAWLTLKLVDSCIRKGGFMRLLGIFTCLLVGGGSIIAGYFIGPIVGWVIMGIGGLIVIVGILRSLTMTKEEIVLEELTEKSEKELQEHERELVKAEARRILEQGKIDDYKRSDLICKYLDRLKFDTESFNLSWDLNKLKKEQIKREKKARR